jgi:hypothetical protein
MKKRSFKAKQLFKNAAFLAAFSLKSVNNVQLQCFLLTFLKAMIRIILVTNTAIPPTRENKANTISALRTEIKTHIKAVPENFVKC